MDNIDFTTPTADEQVATPEQQPTENQPVAEQPQPEQPRPEAENIHRTNWNNAQRRIRSREASRRRIAELEQRLAQYEGKTDEASKLQAQQLHDRIDDMTALTDDDRWSDFSERAYSELGDQAQQLLEQSDRYADYVNAREPDLVQYVNRPNGMRLYKAWCDRMDQPELRRQWLEMTRFEKNRVLDNFYRQLNAAPKSAKTNVPVPAGGRDTASDQPTDDFGVELARSFNRHRGS